MKVLTKKIWITFGVPNLLVEIISDGKYELYSKAQKEVFCES